MEHQITNKTGTLLDYGEVWYHPEALANLLSLHNVKQKLKIKYDSEQEDCFTVHKPDGVRKFVAKTNGLYTLQVCDLYKQTNRSYTGMKFLQTVRIVRQAFRREPFKKQSGQRNCMVLYSIQV